MKGYVTEIGRLLQIVEIKKFLFVDVDSLKSKFDKMLQKAELDLNSHAGRSKKTLIQMLDVFPSVQSISFMPTYYVYSWYNFILFNTQCVQYHYIHYTSRAVDN